MWVMHAAELYLPLYVPARLLRSDAGNGPRASPW
jgi:hypothetical protein